MRDKTTIAIANVYGVKSFTITEFVKKIFFYCVFGLLLIIGGGAIVTYFLTREVKAYAELQDDYETLMAAKNELESNIQEKELELLEIAGKISDIEQLVGLQPQEAVEINVRLDTAKLSAAERLLMLSLIPNGSPIGDVEVTSPFGWREKPLAKGERKFHTGIDLRSPSGAPVYASADGVVDFSRASSKDGYGKLLTLSHAFGFKSMYAHLSKIEVHGGDFVTKGQLVAYSGNTGNSNGPHLHYEVHYLGVALNPINFVRWDLGHYEQIFAKERKVQWQSLASGIEWQWTLLEQLSSSKAPELQARLN